MLETFLGCLEVLGYLFMIKAGGLAFTGVSETMERFINCGGSRQIDPAGLSVCGPPWVFLLGESALGKALLVSLLEGVGWARRSAGRPSVAFHM